MLIDELNLKSPGSGQWFSLEKKKTPVKQNRNPDKYFTLSTYTLEVHYQAPRIHRCKTTAQEKHNKSKKPNMDYNDRVGSKKGGGGIASASIQNIHRRKQVEDVLIGERIPFTGEVAEADQAQTGKEDISKDEQELQRRNPYIYKNHSGKLVCKLCNTMHVSWTSVERHLKGKKHGVNLQKRNNILGSSSNERIETPEEKLQREHQTEREAKIKEIQKAIEVAGKMAVEDFQVCNVENSLGEQGILLKIQYGDQSVWQDGTPPFVRVISGLEVASASDEQEKTNDTKQQQQSGQKVNKDKSYLCVSFPPYENVAVEIPSGKQITFGGSADGVIEQHHNKSLTVDKLNKRACFWDKDNKQFFVQIFFR